jgi:hypothetical protein
MTDLDARLRAALGRVEPPPGLKERVLRKAAQTPPPRGPALLRPALRPWLAAATLLLAVGGAWALRAQAERHRSQEAQAQLLLALQVTSHHLNEAFARVNPPTENP